MKRRVIIRPAGSQGAIVSSTRIVFLAGFGLLFLTGVTSVRHLLDNALSAYLLGWALWDVRAGAASGNRSPLPPQNRHAHLLLDTRGKRHPLPHR